MSDKKTYKNYYVCNCRHNWEEIGNHNEYATCPKCRHGEHKPYKSILNVKTKENTCPKCGDFGFPLDVEHGEHHGARSFETDAEDENILTVIRKYECFYCSSHWDAHFKLECIDVKMTYLSNCE